MHDNYFDDEIIDQISAMDEIIIYGAGVMGQALKLCLESKPYKKRVSLFIVASMTGNPKQIGDARIIELNQSEEYKDRMIFVALNETHMSGAVEELRARGFNNLILLNAAGDEWSHIKVNYFLNNPDQCFLPFRMMERGSVM